MSKMSGRRGLAAILSIATIGAALSLGVAKAAAGDDVTEDQIVQQVLRILLFPRDWGDFYVCLDVDDSLVRFYPIGVLKQ